MVQCGTENRAGLQSPRIDPRKARFMDTSKSSIPQSEQSKTCSICGQTKLLSEYYKRMRNGKSSYRTFCRECEREKNRNRIRQWRAENPEESKRRGRKFYYANREKRLAAAREWRRKNADHVRRYNRAHKQRNKERFKPVVQRWYRNNYSSIKARLQKYRAQKRGVTVGPVPTCEELLSKQKGMCAYCKCKDGPFHVDHIMPLALGGMHTADNVQALCADCNQSKYSKHPLDFAREQGRLL